MKDRRKKAKGRSQREFAHPILNKTVNGDEANKGTGGRNPLYSCHVLGTTRKHFLCHSTTSSS